MDDDDYVESVPQCLSCLKILSGNVKALALDGGQRPNICMSCFDALPSFRRIQLQLFCRPVSKGGLGIRDTLDVIVQNLGGEQEDEDYTPPEY